MKSYGSLCSVTRKMKLWCAKRILRTGITGGSHDLREVTDGITDQVSEGNSSRGDKPAYTLREISCLEACPCLRMHPNQKESGA